MAQNLEVETLRLEEIGQQNSLVPSPGHPFFIVTPPYVRVSAGITVLHLLCHYLNRLGECAYIVHYPPVSTPSRRLPFYTTIQNHGEIPGGMIAPLVTQDIIEYYHEKKITPITIYPEVFDNPLQAPFIARYILNYPGLLAPAFHQPQDYIFAYTRILAEHSRASEVLFLPTVDLEFFNQSGAALERKGTCFYAGKLRSIFKSTPQGVPLGSVEILRSSEMSRERVREIFWQSEVFYCYEDTALAIEAGLCGCPTVFVPNAHFSGRALASEELGPDGFTVLGESEGIERARATVHSREHRIRNMFKESPARISTLAARLKKMAREKDYSGTVRYPYEPRLVFFDQSALQEPHERENRLTEQKQKLQAELRALLTSTSWKMSYPLRQGMRILRPNSGPALTVSDIPDDPTAAAHLISVVRASTSWRITAPLRWLVEKLIRRRRQ